MEEEKNEQDTEQGEPSLNDIKKLLEGKLQTIETDIKELKVDFKTFDKRLVKIETKLNQLDSAVEKSQAEIRNVNQKILGIERRTEGMENVAKNMEEETEDIANDFVDLEVIVENMDNLQWKNNLRICSLREKTEGHDFLGI